MRTQKQPVYATDIIVGVDEGEYVLQALLDEMPKVQDNDITGREEDMTEQFIITVTGRSALTLAQRRFLTEHGLKFGHSYVADEY